MMRSTPRFLRPGLAFVRLAGRLARASVAAGGRALVFVASLCAFVAFLDAIRPGEEAAPLAQVAVQDHRSAVFHMAYSPDGTRLASGTAGREIRLTDATTGLSSTLYRDPVGRPAWI